MEIAIDRSALLSTVTALADRYGAMVAHAPDPSVAVPACPGWTVADVTAHLVTAARRYADGPRGEGDWVDDPVHLPALNERLLAHQRARLVTNGTDELREEIDALVAQVAAYGDDQPVYRFNGGELVAADRALGILVGELLVHGSDVARVLGARWPMPADHVEVVLAGLEAVLAGWVDPARGGRHTAAYDIRVRGGTRHHWAFRHGTLDCRADPALPADCHLSGEPGALLTVMYRRTSPLRVALSGAVVAWGRKPWLALSLPSRFHAP